MIQITGSLETALDLRIEAAKDPDSNLAWTTGKMVWMKFTSNVVQGADANSKPPVQGKTSHFQSLFGGATTTDELYDTKSNRRTPSPGLVSATIKHTGTLKTLKNIEVNYKCWNLKQLGELEKLFMSLGKTVVLEYGWTIKPKGTPVSSMMTTEDHKLSFGAFVKKANKLSKTNGGCYGAEKGVVSNFSWSQDSDGAYSCTTKLSSPAEMMMSQDTKKVSDKAECCKTENQDDGTNCKTDFDVNKKLKQIISSDVIPLNEYRTKDPSFWNKGHNRFVNMAWGFAMKMDKEQTDKEKEDNNWWNRNMKFFASSINTPQRFVTWAWFEEEILNDALLPKSPGAKTSENGTTQGERAPASYRNSEVEAAYRFDCSMTTLANPKYMTSSDPTVCMLPGQNFWDLIHEKKEANAAGSVKDFKNMDGLNSMNDFKVWKTEEAAYDDLGWLSHICINARFLMRCIEESETLTGLVNKVLDGINQACGNHWNLVITPIPENPALMSVVDLKSLGKYISPYPLNILGNHSILQSVTLDTTVNNDIKAQLMYGSNAEDKGKRGEPDDFSLFGLGLSDRTPNWGNMKFKTKNQCVDPADGTTSSTTRTEEADTELENLKDQYTDAWIALTAGVDSDTISTMKATVKALQGHSFWKDIVSDRPPVLPINFSFKLDGLTGFKWGHSLIISPIPDRYNDCTFMVTGIDHSIDLDSWVTSISTVLRIKPVDPKDVTKIKRRLKPLDFSSHSALDTLFIGKEEDQGLSS